MQNAFLRLEFLTEVGPRISGLFPTGSDQNLLAKLDDTHWDTAYGRYTLFGGHRLWAAPEIPEITYLPESQGVHFEETGGRVTLWREDHGKAAYERSIEITLDENAPRVHLVHTLRNLAKGLLMTAPWAITVLPMGSRVRLPLSNQNVKANEFLPNCCLAFWPYDDLQDPRLRIESDFVELTSDPGRDAFKIGVYSTRGWAAAEIGGWLLIKRFGVRDPDARLDFGSNVEAYTNRQFVEFELLGELRNLEQGDCVIHTEMWEIVQGTLDDLNEDGNLPERK